METTQVEPQPEFAPRPPKPFYGPFKGFSPVYRITVAYENHKPGAGEDAPPIWMFNAPDSGLIGAFDGLGGAGGEVIKLPDGSEHPGAWLASRHTMAVVRAVYADMVAQTPPQRPSNAQDEVYDYNQQMDGSAAPAIRRPFDFTARVWEAVRADLAEFAEQTHSASSGLLRSKMIKKLPTTLAVGLYDLGKREYSAIWAGDSRVYCLHPQQGLQQATTDDLKTNADAMENLTADALMSNLVSASADFIFHERRMPLPSRCVLLAATDGCFGYVRTPLHFEYLLLSTMQQASSWQEWEDRLRREIVQITEDDSTLSAAIIGWPDFAACRAEYAPRFDQCAQWIGYYDSRSDKVDELDRDLKQAREDLAAARRELWEGYRPTYERLGSVRTRDFPRQQEGESRPQGGGDPAAKTPVADDKPRHAEEHSGDDGGET